MVNNDNREYEEDVEAADECPDVAEKSSILTRNKERKLKYIGMKVRKEKKRVLGRVLVGL